MKLFWIVTITVLCFLKETQSKNYLEDLTISTNEKKILDKVCANIKKNHIIEIKYFLFYSFVKE